MDVPNSVEKIKLLKLWRSWIRDYVIIMTMLDNAEVMMTMIPWPWRTTVSSEVSSITAELWDSRDVFAASLNDFGKAKTKTLFFKDSLNSDHSYLMRSAWLCTVLIIFSWVKAKSDHIKNLLTWLDALISLSDKEEKLPHLCLKCALYQACRGKIFKKGEETFVWL